MCSAPGEAPADRASESNIFRRWCLSIAPTTSSATESAITPTPAAAPAKKAPECCRFPSTNRIAQYDRKKVPWSAWVVLMRTADTCMQQHFAKRKA